MRVRVLVQPFGPRFESDAATPCGPPRARNAARHDGLWRAPAAPGARDIVYRAMEEFVFRDEHCVVHQASLGSVREGSNSGAQQGGVRGWLHHAAGGLAERAAGAPPAWLSAPVPACLAGCWELPGGFPQALAAVWLGASSVQWVR